MVPRLSYKLVPIITNVWNENHVDSVDHRLSTELHTKLHFEINLHYYEEKYRVTSLSNYY